MQGREAAEPRVLWRRPPIRERAGRWVRALPPRAVFLLDGCCNPGLTAIRDIYNIWLVTRLASGRTQGCANISIKQPLRSRRRRRRRGVPLEAPAPNSGAVREASPSAFPAAGGLAFVPLSSDETSFPTIAAPPPEYSAGSGGAVEDGAKPRGIVSVDDETLRRMSLEIFRDLGLKEAAIAAYFARYGRLAHRGA